MSPRSHLLLRRLGVILAMVILSWVLLLAVPVQAQSGGAGLKPNPLGTDYITNTVYALAYDATYGKTYVGGDFTGVTDATGVTKRNFLARLNADGAVDTSFTVQTGDDVRALLLVGNYLYVGGFFDGGGSENCWDANGVVSADQFFRVDLTTGLIDRTWKVTTGFSNVYALAYITGTTNYLVVGMSGSSYAKAINAANVASTVTLPSFDTTVRTLLVDGSTLYVGGDAFGGAGLPDYLRRYTLSGTTFTRDATWNPVIANGKAITNSVRGLTVYNNQLYVGGLFADASVNTDYHYLLRIPLTSTTGVMDTDWRPQLGSSVYSFERAGGILYTGGNFSSPGFQVARFDLSQTLPQFDQTWRPTMGYMIRDSRPLDNGAGDYEDVYAMAVTSDRVYLGGDFASVNGVARVGGLAAVEKAGIVIPSAPVLVGTPTGSGRGPYTFTGTATADLVVSLYAGNAVIGSTTAAPGGSWSITTGSALATGMHRFTAIAAPTYQAGSPAWNESDASNAVTLTITSAVTNPTGQTFSRQTTGTGTCTTGDNPCSGYLALYLQQDGGGDLLNLLDPPAASPTVTNSVTLTASGASPQNTATLLVTAYDVDWPTGEWDYIYLNGHLLGRLTGTSNTWTATLLPIPDLTWINAGANRIQFRVTSDGETLYHRWSASIASVVLLIDGGAGSQGQITRLNAPLPLAGVITPTVVFTTTAFTTTAFTTTASPVTQMFRLETQLLAPSGETVAAVVSANLVVNASAIYTSTPGLAYAAADYTGYTVRAVLYVLSDGFWLPQGSRDRAVGDPPLATPLDWLDVVAVPGRVTVQWETASEADTLGFNLYRAVVGGAWTQLNATLIPSQAPGSPASYSYRYNDLTAACGSVYRYRLAAVGLAGQEAVLETVQAVVPYWLWLPKIER